MNKKLLGDNKLFLIEKHEPIYITEDPEYEIPKTPFSENRLIERHEKIVNDVWDTMLNEPHKLTCRQTSREIIKSLYRACHKLPRKIKKQRLLKRIRHLKNAMRWLYTFKFMYENSKKIKKIARSENGDHFIGKTFLNKSVFMRVRNGHTVGFIAEDDDFVSPFNYHIVDGKDNEALDIKVREL